MFKLIIFTDNAGKYDFGGKRQSQDAIVFDTVIFDHLENCRVYTNSEATRNMLTQYGCPSEISVIDEFEPVPATDEECALVLEAGDYTPFMPFVEKIVHVDWGRNYLGSRKFSVDVNKFDLIDEEAMVGSSHDNVCVKTYLRR